MSVRDCKNMLFYYFLTYNMKGVGTGGGGCKGGLTSIMPVTGNHDKNLNLSLMCI